MAIVQTGLGWYANSDWLMNAPGTIGELRSSAAITEAFIITVDSNGAYSDGVFHFRLNGDTSISSFTMTPIENAGITKVEFDFEYSLDGYGAGAYLLWPANPYSSYPINQYCYFSDLIGCRDTAATYCVYPADSPIGSGHCVVDFTKSGGQAKIQLVSFQYGGTLTISNVEITGSGGASTIFDKTTVGYSVVCLCEWNAAAEGDVYISPVLISSDPNYTIYQRNTSTPSVPATEHTYQGMTFYMRKAPLDVFDPSATIITDYSVVVLTNPSAGVTNNDIFNAIRLASGLGVGYPPQPSDPYAAGGTSGPDSGDGTMELITENITRPTAPSFTFADTGFTRIFVPTLSQLKSLAQYLWTDGNFIQFIIDHGIKQFLEDPSQALISLSYLPCSIPHSVDPVDVKILFVDTGVDMYGATTQFVDVNCGSVFINELYGSALDYNPYTKVSLFLPFIGVVDLDTDEVMNKNIYVNYRIDIVSGGCVAQISAGDSISDNTVLYQFTGDCAINMPFNSADFTGYRAALIGAVETLTLAGAAAGAGIMASQAGSYYVEQATTASGAADFEFAETYDRYRESMARLAEKRKAPYKEAQASFKDAAKKTAANTVASVIGSKMAFQHGSGFTGNTGVLGVRRPYVIIKRPDMCNPDEYGTYNGRPSQMYLSLATLSGYTELQSIHLTGIPATNPELSEIGDFLQKGVIL